MEEEIKRNIPEEFKEITEEDKKYVTEKINSILDNLLNLAKEEDKS